VKMLNAHMSNDTQNRWKCGLSEETCPCKQNNLWSWQHAWNLIWVSSRHSERQPQHMSKLLPNWSPSTLLCRAWTSG